MKVKKETVIGVACVLFGFLGAFLLFRFLTSSAPQHTLSATVSPVQQVSPLSSSLPKHPPAASAVPEAGKVPLIKQETGKAQGQTEKLAAEGTTNVVFEEDAEGVAFPPLRVNGILSASEGNIALINDIIVREGDSILGARITNIQPNYIEVEMKGEKKVVRVR